MDPRTLFAVAAVALSLDAIGFSLGALRPLEHALAPADGYWRRRLRLNLLLANHGLYLAAAAAWLAVAFFTAAPSASALLALGGLASATWSVVAIPWFTRRDVAQALPRAVGLAAYVAAFVAATLPPVPEDFLHPAPSSAPAVTVRATSGTGGTPLRVVRLMHAMALLEAGGERVLTDPWWSSRRHYDAGEALGASAADLQPLSLITSGQDHYDHSDISSLSFVSRQTPILVPEGTSQRAAAEAAGFQRVSALRPWETVQVGDVRVTAVPAREGVSPTDFDFELAWHYQLGGRSALFVGHRLAPAMAEEVARRFGPVDVALVAINELRVRPQLGRQLSMSPEDAADVVRASGARVAVPIHYRYHGSWLQEALLLSHEGTPERFTEVVRTRSPGTVVQVLAPGQPLLVE